MIATASKPIRKRRQIRAHRCTFKNAYTRFFTRVQYGPNLYAGYYAQGLGMDPWGLEKGVVEAAYAFGTNTRATGQIFYTTLIPGCRCKADGTWYLPEIRLTIKGIMVYNKLTFHLRRGISQLKSTCTLTEEMMEATRKHEEKHEENYKREVDLLNRRFAGNYGGGKFGEQTCSLANDMRDMAWTAFSLLEADHKHPKSPKVLFDDIQELYDILKDAGRCSPEVLR